MKADKRAVRSMLKTIIIDAYCRGWISMRTTTILVRVFGLEHD